ncbi:neprilysin-1-like [Ornithodoros turicata]|uniref:neprilysin-1-like n=1 Tax=Ornithodoros turicata TaxID=34597 RepID=UPI0031396624
MAYHLCKNDNVSATDEAQALKHLLSFVGISGWPLWGAPSLGESDVFCYDCFAKILLQTGYASSSSVINLFVDQDSWNVTQYVVIVSEPAFGIGRNQLLNATADDNRPIVDAYKTFMRESIKVFQEGLRDDEINVIVEDMFRLEVELAMRTRSPESRRQRADVKMSIAELQEQVPQVQWKVFLNTVLENINVTLNDDELILVREPEFVKSAAQLLKNTDRRTTYNYMAWSMLRNVAPTTSRVFRELRFAFEQVAEGVPDRAPLWKKCVDSLNDLAEDAIGRLYVERKFKAQAKEDVAKLVEDLRETFALVLNESSWMDAETKEEALRKLKLTEANIAYSDKILNNTYLDRKFHSVNEWNNETSFLDVFTNFTYSQVTRELKKLHRSHNRTDEDPMQAAVADAFYSREGNTVNFPAGILQIPFYALGLPIAVNMGAIGVVIGHEITHGFDDMGSRLDSEGNLRNWWTNATRAHYEEKAQCFIHQYSDIRDEETNMTLEGINTLDDNVADCVGIRVAFKAHQIAQRHKENKPVRTLPGLKKYSAEQMFFIAMAQTWCTNTRTEKLRELIQYDDHSPAKYRVNVPVANFGEFAKAFNCPEDSPMNPKHKCILW